MRWPGAYRWVALSAWPTSVVAISRPAAAAIEKALLIMKVGSFGSRSTADLGPSALASPAANANARLRVPSTRERAEHAICNEAYCEGAWTVHNPRPTACAEPRARKHNIRTRSAPMTLKASLYVTVAAIGIASFVSAAPLRAQTAVAIDNDDIGGVVTGTNGPEAGVWVIAETTDLPTKFAKIVVTDDQGRYVVPDLPKANYQVWVRGYGLVDSPKVSAKPGQQLNLTAGPPPTQRAGAPHYSALYSEAVMPHAGGKDVCGAAN